MPLDELDLSAGLLPESPKPRRGGINRDRILEIARSDNIPDDIADDFAKVMNFESGGSHYDRRGKVKLSPPDPKTGERAVGLTQIKPSTAREMGVKDPFDENENLKAGLRYFAKGGSDPAGRRIHYFGGPKPLQRYQRTGRIPKGKDVLGTTFEKYVQQTGGQQKVPQIDLSAGLVDDLDAGLEDSGQNLPPSKATSVNPSRAPSVPKTTLKTRPQFGQATPGQRKQIEAGVREFERPQRRGGPDLIDRTIPDLTKIVPEAPLTFEQDRAQRVARQQASTRILKEASRQGVKVNALRQQVAAEMSRPETYSDQYGTRQRMSTPDPQAVEQETVRRAQAQVEELARKGRISKMGPGEYLAQLPKSPAIGAASAVGTALKGLATVSRKIVDQVADTRGFDTRDAHVYKLGEYIESKSKEILQSNPDLEKEFFIGKAPSTIGQVGVFVLGGWATKSPKLAVSVLGGTMTAGDAYDEVRALGGTDEEGVNAGLIAGAILGPTELLGMRGAMKAISGTAQEETLKAALKTALREGRKDVIENALQEMGQEFAQGKITGQARSIDELLETGILGGIGGTVTVPVTLASQIGGRRGTQSQAQSNVAAQPETVEPGNVVAEVGRSGVDVLPRSEVVAPETGAPDTQLPETATQPQRFYHRDYGEVTESPDQRRVGKGRIRVVAEDGTPHVIKRSAMTGAGNQRAVPIRTESSPDLNLEAGLEPQPAETLPESPVEPSVSSMAEGATAPFPPETSISSERVIDSAQTESPIRPERSGQSAPAKSAKPLERTAAGFKSDLSLSQFVRKMGGIVPGEMYRGELDRIRMRETGTSGLINQKAKQGNVPQTADIMMQSANDAGFRDPETGQPFENPGDFLYAVERDVLGEKIRVQSGGETDWDAEIRKHEFSQPDLVNDADARVSLLENDESGSLYDRIAEGKANESELQQFRQYAKDAGLSERGTEDLIASARTDSVEETSGVSEAARPAQQLGFAPEGLEQQVATPPRSTPLRDALIRSEQARQQATDPEHAATLSKLAEIRRRGMTVDDYARQPDLFGNLPSQEEVAQLKAVESSEQVSPVPDQPEMFGPGTMRVGESLPEVKERKFGQRFVEDERIAEEIRDIGTARYYEPVPNKITVAEAEKLVEKRGLAESITIIKDETNTVPAHIRSVMGQSVILKLNRAFQNLKDSNRQAADRVLDTSVDLAEWLMDYGTRLGQGVQAFAVWARLTPEGKLLTYKRGVRKARDRHKERHGEEVEEIISVVNKYGMTDAERLEALKNLFKTNKTAKKIKTDFEKLLKAAKTGKLTDETFYEVAAEKLGLPVYNQEIARKLTELAHQIEAAPEGLPRTKLVLELQKFLAQQKGFDVADLPLGIFYGNILSGYNTHAVNFADTALNVVSEINGLALLEPRAAAKIYSGMLRGFAEGRWDAMMALTEGRMFRDSKWLDAPGLMEIAKFGQKGGVPIKTETRTGRVAKRIAESKIAIPLNAYKYVTRAMSAADAVNARAASEARSTLLAYRTAQAEGLKGDALESRVREILALDKHSDFLKQAEREGFTGREAEFRATELRDIMRPKDLSADAAEFAGEATYNHKPHGTLGLIAETVGNLSNRIKPLKLFVPFTRIVANVTNRGLNWTPYGYKRAVWGWGFGERAEPLTAEGRRVMMTRATLGTTGMVLLGVLQEAGLLAIHGNGPSDREKRRQMQQAKWKPYSIQIGDAYISYVYSPVGLGLSIIGNMTDATRYHELEQKDAATKGAYAVARLGSTIFSQSFLSGLSRLFGALSDEPGKSVTSVKQTLGGTVSAFAVPNIARDIHRLFDNKAYQSNTLMEDLVRGTPFAALFLKPTLNAFGEPVKLQRQRFFDIQTSDPAWKFVIEKGLRVPVPGRTIEMADGRRITPEEYYDLLKTTGPKVKDWIVKNRTRLAKMKEQDAQEELSEAATKIRKFELTRMKMKIRKKAA